MEIDFLDQLSLLRYYNVEACGAGNTNAVNSVLQLICFAIPDE